MSEGPETLGMEPPPRGPFRPQIPDVPESWDRFLTKLAAWTASIIAFGTLVLTQVQSCQSKNVQVQHGAEIDANKERLDQHASELAVGKEKIKEIKAAMPDKP